MKKCAKHNLLGEERIYIAELLEKGEQRCERGSALAARDQAPLNPLKAQASSAQDKEA